MEPTARQQEVIDLSVKADKPIMWLGAVREGKTVGSCLALMHAMQRRPGDYGVFTFSTANFTNSVRPTILKILDYWDEPFVERKAPPKYIETDHGRLLFFTASDSGMEKVLQGATFQGAFSDEILLYPKNVVMQTVARFTHDNPLWLMTANKENPYHWIKTEWIDHGKVLVVNSERGDNPHVSDDARKWQDDLLSGHYKDRMLGNDWSAELNQVGIPKLLKNGRKANGRERPFESFWTDDARYHVLVRGIASGNEITVSDCLTFSGLAELEEHLREPWQSIGNWVGDVARQAKGSLVTLYKPDYEVYARSLSRVAGRIGFLPQQKHLCNLVANWSYRLSSEHDLESSLAATPPEVLAVAQAAHHMLRSVQAFGLGDSQWKGSL